MNKEMLTGKGLPENRAASVVQRYDHIQVFRVLACLGVFFTHLVPRMGASGLVYRVANFGASGVYLFFLISGFLACGSRELFWKGRGKDTLAYYIRRLFRILPLYYVVVFAQILLHQVILRDVPPDPGGLYWLRYFLLTDVVLPAPSDFWGNLGATWTIGLFVAFYLLAPLLMRIARSAPSALFLYLAAVGLRYVWAGLGLSAYMMLFHYLHFFLLGIWVRYLSERMSPAKGAACMAVLSLGLGVGLSLLHQEGDYFMRLSWLFAVLILLTGDFSWDKSRCHGLGKLFSLLDTCSYGIYLVHGFVLEGIGRLQGHIALPAPFVLCLAVLLTAAGVWAARRLVEEPMEKLGRKLVAGIRIC